MIRPFTIATCLLACGSGLYLYQSKHEVQLLDKTIERTVHETAALRAQSVLLSTEWTMLNDPERLRQFSDTYLSLKTITPSQFISLVDLDTRLPAVQAPVASHATDEQELLPVASGDAAGGETDPAAVADEDLPVPPVPPIPGVPPASPVTVAARPGDGKGPVVRPAVADGAGHLSLAAAPAGLAAHTMDAQLRLAAVQPARPIVLATPRPPLQAMAQVPRPAGYLPNATGLPPLPTGPSLAPPPIYPPATSATAMPRAQAVAAPPYSASLLGMARGSLPPAPRPTPVSASYNSN